MRNLFIFFLLLFGWMYACQDSADSQNDRLRLEAKIEGLEDGTLTLIIPLKDSLFRDTVMIQNGRFSYETELTYPTYLQIIGQSNQRLMFFIEPGNISLTADINTPGDLTVSGSHTQKQAESFNDEMKFYNSTLDSLMKEYQQLQQAGTWEQHEEDFMTRYEWADSIRQLAVKRYLKEHGDEAYSAFLIQNNFSMTSDAQELEELYAVLSGAGIDNPWSGPVKEMVAVKKKTAIGEKILHFAQEDTNGDLFDLNTLHGKVYLIDFWASWCGPCRQENPNVVETYKEFHDRGFEILGVSLDTDRDRWLEAIRADQLDWYQVSDLQGWSNVVAQEYGIRTIPANILVDRNGVIIKKDLRGRALIEAVAESL